VRWPVPLVDADFFRFSVVKEPFSSNMLKVTYQQEQIHELRRDVFLDKSLFQNTDFSQS
jgi:hypothetical protein